MFNADFHYFKLFPFQRIAFVSGVISINKPSVDIVEPSSYLSEKLNNSLLLLLGIHLLPANEIKFIIEEGCPYKKSRI